MSDENNIDRRQFILMKRPYEKNGFQTTELKSGFYFSHHEQLNIKVDNDSILLGYAFNVGAKGEVDLLGDPVSKMYQWSGRWILIHNDRLYLDACGTLGCFYTYDKDGSIICSSSLHLMEEVIANCVWCSNQDIQYGSPKVFDFYPGPSTPVKPIRALLPSQYIVLSEGKIRNREDFDFSRFDNRNKEEIIDEIIEAGKNIFCNIEREFAGNIWIPMTGGVDSRTIFALSVKAGIRFKTYSLLRYNTPKDDLKIPRKLARRIGVEHKQFKILYDESDDNIEMMKKDIIKHCGGKTTAGTEIGQYLGKIDVPNAKDAIVLWGTVWELGARYYYASLKGKTPEMKKEHIEEFLNNMGDGEWKNYNIHEESFAEWIDHIVNNPVKGLNWVDRLYWEQRLGAWLKYSYQMYDMMDSARISPVNCQMILERFFAFDYDYQNRRNKGAQRDIIEKACPQISDIGYLEKKQALIHRFIKTLHTVTGKENLLPDNIRGFLKQ